MLSGGNHCGRPTSGSDSDQCVVDVCVPMSARSALNRYSVGAYAPDAVKHALCCLHAVRPALALAICRRSTPMRARTEL